MPKKTNAPKAPKTKKARTFDRYGAAKLAADRLSVPDKYPAVGTATAAEVKAVDGPLEPTADPADGLKPKRLWAVVPVKPGTAKAQKIAEAAEARRDLRAMLKPGARVYTNLRNVSSSGMSRQISVHVAERDGRIRDITRLVARASDERLTKDGDALVVGGCGMDMGFHVIYGLASVLYPDGFNDGEETRRDGGYALKQEWI